MRHEREKNHRSDITEGSMWVPFLATNRMAPSVTVAKAPAPEAEHVAVRSYGGKSYATRISSLLGNYYLVKQAVVPVEQPSRPAEVVEPLPCALRRLPVAPAPEPIAPLPEDIGVKVYDFRGRLCVVAATVGRALGYADGSLVARLRGEWGHEFVRGQDMDVLIGADLREFKGLPGLATGDVGSRAPNVIILYESGFDLVLQKTDKPEGQKLRRRLADEVLPKLRRGQPVVPAGAPLPPQPAPAPVLSAADIAAIVAAVVPVVLKALPQGPALPAAPVAPAGPVVVPRSWLGVTQIAAVLRERHKQAVPERSVREALDAMRVHEDPSLAIQGWTKKSSHGSEFTVPFWRFAPSVVEDVEARLLPAQQKLPGTH